MDHMELVRLNSIVMAERSIRMVDKYSYEVFERR